MSSPFAWIGLRDGFIEQFDNGSGRTEKAPLLGKRVWLRAECDFFTERATFCFSGAGRRFQPLGEPFRMVFQLKTFQGVSYSLFHYSGSDPPGGFADFTDFTVGEPLCHAGLA